MMSRYIHRPLFLLLSALLTACDGPPTEQQTEIRVSEAMSGSDDGFQKALQPRIFSFPQDHGPHPGFKHEWWYFTGNLSNMRGDKFGYQVTFFRIGLKPGIPQRKSQWATQAIWMAHVAISDVKGQQHLAAERFSRDAAGLSGASRNEARIWVEDWRILRPADDGSWQIRINSDEFSLYLDLKALRKPVLQGDKGLSQKSNKPGNASYYYSIPRLETVGSVQIGTERHQVKGLSWLDREWSTSALGEDQAGWDWFSIQLDDGTDLMYYQLRLNSGESDPLSKGMLLTSKAERMELNPQNTRITPLDWWQSNDGRSYPILWRMRINATGDDLLIRAMIEDQLMEMSVRYWEGAVEILREPNGKPIGHGYLEMTGY